MHKANLVNAVHILRYAHRIFFFFNKFAGKSIDMINI